MNESWQSFREKKMGTISTENVRNKNKTEYFLMMRKKKFNFQIEMSANEISM